MPARVHGGCHFVRALLGRQMIPRSVIAQYDTAGTHSLAMRFNQTVRGLRAGVCLVEVSTYLFGYTYYFVV